MDNLEVDEFDVLGFRLRFRSEASNGNPDQNVAAIRVVDCVQQRALEIKKNSPHLKADQVIILVALELAKEKLMLEQEFQKSLNKIELTALDALHYIEGVVPAN